MAAVVGARLMKYIRSSWDSRFLPCVMWSDSMIVLSWIRGQQNKLGQFVKNKVTEIIDATGLEPWRYCPGDHNPSDLLTRGISARALRESSSWWNGPKWLEQPRSAWPEESDTNPKPCQDYEPAYDSPSVLLQAQRHADTLIDITKFGDLQKLLHVTAWFFQFVNRTRRMPAATVKTISAEELINAEMFWICRVQQEAFLVDIQRLLHGNAAPKHSILKDLHPFIDQSKQLRLGGRLERMGTTYEEKHPIILPGHHHFTKLVVIEAHCKSAHGGIASTMVHVRQRFWIIRARQETKRVINACFPRYSANPAKMQYAPLTLDRLVSSRPFEVVGLDFAGPLHIMQTALTATACKGYILLLTCATTRAVHLELTSGLSAEAFLLAFRRFLAHRGLPQTLYSDKALAFKKTSRNLKDIWDVMKSSPFASFLAKHRVQWKFIVPGAPWWGGLWERLIRSIKTSLRKVLGKSYLNSEETETVLLEVEAVINSRPLTYTYTEAMKPSAICPAHFLVRRSLMAVPRTHSSEYETRCVQATTVTKKWRYRQKLLDHLWIRWKKEYLLELRSLHRYPSGASSDVKVDDVVLVEQPNISRCIWRLGRIVEVYPGQDAVVRACRIKTQNGKFVRDLHRNSTNSSWPTTPLGGRM